MKTEQLIAYLSEFAVDMDEQAYAFLLALYDHAHPRNASPALDENRIARRNRITDYTDKGGKDWSMVGDEIMPPTWRCEKKVLVNQDHWEMEFSNKRAVLLDKPETFTITAKRYDCAYAIGAFKALVRFRKRMKGGQQYPV